MQFLANTFDDAIDFKWKRSEIILETLGTFPPSRIKIIRRETRPLWNIFYFPRLESCVNPAMISRKESKLFLPRNLLRFLFPDFRVKRSMPAQLFFLHPFQDLKISRLPLKGPSNLSISLQINLIISSFTFVYLFLRLYPRLFSTYPFKSTRFSGVNRSVEMISLKSRMNQSRKIGSPSNHFLNGVR